MEGLIKVEPTETNVFMKAEVKFTNPGEIDDFISELIISKNCFIGLRELARKRETILKGYKTRKVRMDMDNDVDNNDNKFITFPINRAV